MKGSAATIILVLIIVGIAGYFILTTNVLQLGPSTTLSDNTVIHLTNKLISDTSPLPNEKVSISFMIANYGDKPVNNVTVDFFDIVGFTSPSLSCQMVDSAQMFTSANNRWCNITNIQPGDARQVNLLIDTSGATSQGIVQYSVSYDYGGTRIFQIPVIDQGATLPRGINYIINPSTVGPLQVNFEPPVGSQQQVNGNTVTENFARRGIPFKIQFDITDVGNPEGTKTPVVLSGSDITMATTKFKIDQCDRLQASGNTATIPSNVNLTVPTDTSITCILEDDSTTPINGFDMGTVQISFNYLYSFQNSDSFAIKSSTQ